jgi:outer membrane protein OmpA-like peptidoglycan-associated protein
MLSTGQSARRIEKLAGISFEQKNYSQAATLYAAALYDSPLAKPASMAVYPFQSVRKSISGHVKHSRRTEMVFKLADSYRLNKMYREAGIQYAYYLSQPDAKNPMTLFWLGFCQLAVDEPQKAIASFENFLKTHKTNDSLFLQAKTGMASAVLNLESRKQLPVAVVTKLAATVSADGSDFALETTGGDNYLFTSSRHEFTNKKEKIFPLRLYTGNFKSNFVQKITALAAPGANMAASSLSADQLTLFFTGWKEADKKGPSSTAIYFISRKAIDSPWSVPQLLPAPVNIQGYDSRHPFITKDNKILLFSSNQPGGLGKFDLWMVGLENKYPEGLAKNLGPVINTRENELTPYYDRDASILYFSTDGRIGMGGFDIFQTKGNLDENNWPFAVLNSGRPVNSVKDDLYFSKKGISDTAYLSSDRASSCCLEIFQSVAIKKTDTIAAQTVKPLIREEIKPAIAPAEETVKNEAHLLDSIKAITVSRIFINYNFASSALRKIDFASLDKMVAQLKSRPELNILVASFTDCKGTDAANIALSRKRSESVKAYLIKKGIAVNRINIDFFGKQHFVMPCKEDSSYKADKQIANRRSDLILTREKKPVWRPFGNELDIVDFKQGNKGNNKSDTIVYLVQHPADTIAEKNTAGKENTKLPASINNGPTKGTVHLSGTKNRTKYLKSVNPLAAHKQISQEPEKNRDKSAPQRKTYATVAARGTKEQVRPAKKDTAELKYRLPVISLLDFSPRTKSEEIVEEMTKRTPRKPLFLYSSSDSVRVDLYDNGVFDYDTVSVIYNKQLVSYKQVLMVNKPITFYVKLNADQSKNEMIFFAENMGLTPPNSALMIITDGENKRTEVNVASDLEHNTVIYFIKVKKENP